MRREPETDSESGPDRIWPLTFQNNRLEADFRRSYWVGGLPYARIAMLSAAVLGAAFGVLDRLVAGYALQQLSAIRFGFMVPVILIGLGLSFVPFFQLRYHIVIMITTVCVGGSIIAMIAIIQPPASDYYYAGLIMVLFFTYTFLQLRFLHAVIAAIILFSGYELVAILSLSGPPEAILNNTFFLVATNYGGMFACYSIERIRRKNFWQIHVIREERHELSITKKQLERISARDELTGLFNRRQLTRSFSELMMEFSLGSKPVAVMLIDLDNFKKVNDVCGHVTGDEVLKKVAAVLLDCSAATDLVFRYGGDEFVILQPGESALSGTTTARRITAGFKRWAETSIVARSTQLGVSIGLTEFLSSADTLESLMKHADTSLYRAKHMGKGCIVAIPRHQPPDPEGGTV